MPVRLLFGCGRTALLTNASFSSQAPTLCSSGSPCRELHMVSRGERETWLLVLSGNALAGSLELAATDVVLAQSDRIAIRAGGTGMVGTVAYTGVGPVPHLLQCVPIRFSGCSWATNGCPDGAFLHWSKSGLKAAPAGASGQLDTPTSYSTKHAATCGRQEPKVPADARRPAKASDGPNCGEVGCCSQGGLGHQMPNRHEIGPKSDPDPKWLTVVWMLTAIVCVCGLIWISFI